VLFLAAAGVASAYAAAPATPELPQRDIFESGAKSLIAGTTYQATAFPLAIRLTAVGGGWSGAQWKANTWPPGEIAKRHLHCPQVCKPPYYGWVAFAQGPPAGTPRGLIVIMTGFDKTPSVSATAAALHRGNGVVYEPSEQTKLARFTATQFAGHTAGAEHYFLPFSPPSHGAAGSAADQIEMTGPDHPFRFSVLNVKGKTVVVLVGSLVLSADKFEGFLREADRVLASMRFPS
jgi:hypothetical protein